MEIKDFLDSCGQLERHDYFNGLITIAESSKLNGLCIITCGDTILSPIVFDSLAEGLSKINSVDYEIISAFCYALFTKFDKVKK